MSIDSPKSKWGDPFEEIHFFAENAARNFLHYLTYSQGSFSPEECQEIVGVLLSFTKLVPEDLELSPEVKTLLETVTDPRASQDRGLSLVTERLGGQKERSSKFTPFSLMRLYAEPAAEQICKLLKARRGELTLDECQEIRQIFNNFTRLLPDGYDYALGAKPLPDSVFLRALRRLVFPNESKSQDAYFSLVENYASLAAKEEHRCIMACFEPQASPVETALPEEGLSFAGRVQELRAAASSFFSLLFRTTNEP